MKVEKVITELLSAEQPIIAIPSSDVLNIHLYDTTFTIEPGKGRLTIKKRRQVISVDIADITSFTVYPTIAKIYLDTPTFRVYDFALEVSEEAHDSN